MKKKRSVKAHSGLTVGTVHHGSIDEVIVWSTQRPVFTVSLAVSYSGFRSSCLLYPLSCPPLPSWQGAGVMVIVPYLVDT